jgi:hypothetical protein
MIGLIEFHLQAQFLPSCSHRTLDLTEADFTVNIRFSDS